MAEVGCGKCGSVRVIPKAKVVSCADRPDLGLRVVIASAVFVATVMAGNAAAAQQSATSAQLLERFKTTTVFWQQFELAKELAKVGDAQTLAALEPLLRDDDRHVRANAAFVFAGRGDARGLEALTTILADRSDRPLGQGMPGGLFNTAVPNWWVPGQIRADRYYAVHVLGELGDRRGVEILIPLLADRKSTTTPRGPWARFVTVGPSDH